jgi:threonine/homoserine/homoserine lactone efflux protein
MAQLAAFLVVLLLVIVSVFVLLPLGLLFCSLTLCWLSCYAIAVARAGDLLRRPRVRRLFDGAPVCASSRSVCASRASSRSRT